MVASGAAALCFWKAGDNPSLLLVAPLLCYLRLWLNMLDGMVALASGKASLRGEILNDLPDRVSDVVVFVGVAHSGLAKPYLGYWGAVMSVLVAYVGTFGQAVTGRREFSGIMSKPWRMVVLHVGAWTTWGCMLWKDTGRLFGSWTVLDAFLALILIGCVQTIVQRLSRIMTALREKAVSRS